jgi:hypothetical protein
MFTFHAAHICLALLIACRHSVLALSNCYYDNKIRSEQGPSKVVVLNTCALNI